MICAWRKLRDVVTTTRQRLRAVAGRISHGLTARRAGRVIYAGMASHEKAFAMGWNDGWEDAELHEPRDSTLAVEDSWYASGYRDGWDGFCAWNPSKAPGRTVMGLGRASEA